MRGIHAHAFFAATCIAAATAGCASPSLGEGRFLMISTNNKVVAEIDTGAGGMAGCTNQAAMTRLPAGYEVRCVSMSSEESLPFAFRAHQQKRESEGFKPSSPYWLRADSRARCRAMRDATARGEKTVIVEDKCG